MACCFACILQSGGGGGLSAQDRSTAAELEGQRAGGFCSNLFEGRRSRRTLRALGGDSHEYAHGRRKVGLRRRLRVSWAVPVHATTYKLVKLHQRGGAPYAGRRSRTGAPCNKGVGDVGTGPNSRTEQNRTSSIGAPTALQELRSHGHRRPSSLALTGTRRDKHQDQSAPGSG
jgi:hypothetical protein